MGNDARNDALPLLVTELSWLKCVVAARVGVKLNGRTNASDVESKDAIIIRVIETLASGYNLN